MIDTSTRTDPPFMANGVEIELPPEPPQTSKIVIEATKDGQATPLQRAKEAGVQYMNASPPGSWRSVTHSLGTGLMVMVAWSSWTSVDIASIAGVVVLVVTVLLQGWLWNARNELTSARLAQLLKEHEGR